MPGAVTTRGVAALSGARESASGASVSPGDVIGGRYVVEEVLGTGGMGVVLAARHEALGHRVAMKLVSASTSPDADAFVRFSREARIIASLESDHVVRILDYGMHAGTPYMVMELLAGRDLGAELKLRGAMPIEEVADYVIQACEGLSVAHGKGIVHRDVKLANLFLALRADGERVVKVLDFGVSKLQAEAQDDVHLTRTTSMLGSPLYMSPEQIRDPRSVDERADIWSLGIVLYKLLTNDSPFNGLNANAVCAAIAADPPAAIAVRAPHLPDSLAAVVLRCLEKQPELRYPNVAALARALAPYASAKGRTDAEQLVARAASDGIALGFDEHTPTSQARPFDTGAYTIDAPTRARRGRRVVEWVGVAALLVAIAGVTAAWKLHDTTASAKTVGTPVVVSTVPLPVAAPSPPTLEIAAEPEPKERVPAPARASGASTASTRHVNPPRALSTATTRSPVTRRPVAAAPTSHFGGSALDAHN